MSGWRRHGPPDDTPDRTPERGADELLEVQVGGGKGEPERLFILSRPRRGQVEVREFRFGAEPLSPIDYTASCAELLDAFQRAHGERRRLSEDLYRIKLWLDDVR